MSRLTARDYAAVTVFLVGAGAVALLALFGLADWAVGALALLTALVGIVVRLQFASRRPTKDRRSPGRASTRSAEATYTQVKKLANELAMTRRELAQMRLDAAEGVSAIGNVVAREIASARADVARLAEEVANVKNGIGEVRASVARQSLQLEGDVMTGVQALTQLLARYTPTAPLPAVAGWALSPAGLEYVTDAIEQRRMELAVECGSGTSTLWMAMAMRRKGSGQVLALEHDDSYARKTRALLQTHGLSEWAEVLLCPLIQVATPRGDHLWYDFDVQSLPRKIDILLVDGPPGTTGRHARYPALPVMDSMLAERSLVVIDDADRPDEREVLKLWAAEWPSLVALSSPGRGVQVLGRIGDSRVLDGR